MDGAELNGRRPFIRSPSRLFRAEAVTQKLVIVQLLTQALPHRHSGPATGDRQPLAWPLGGIQADKPLVFMTVLASRPLELSIVPRSGEEEGPIWGSSQIDVSSG